MQTTRALTLVRVSFMSGMNIPTVFVSMASVQHESLDSGGGLKVESNQQTARSRRTSFVNQNQPPSLDACAGDAKVENANRGSRSFSRKVVQSCFRQFCVQDSYCNLPGPCNTRYPVIHKGPKIMELVKDINNINKEFGPIKLPTYKFK